MTALSQRDPKWANTNLGFSTAKIGVYGCTITCLAMIIGTTPDVVNDRLRAVNGFASGNLVIWGKIEEAFPGIKINRVWAYNNTDVLAHVPNVLVEVPAAPIGGTGSHWVVYLGNKRLNDPWTGKERPTSDFPNPTGYCTITGAWKQADPAPIAQPIAQPAALVFNDQTKLPAALLGTDQDLEIQQIRGLLGDLRRLQSTPPPPTPDPSILLSISQTLNAIRIKLGL